MNMHTCAKFVPDRSRCFASFPHYSICEPLTPSICPLGLEWLTFFSLCPFPVNLYTCATFGPDRSSGLEAFPDELIDDRLNPIPLRYQGVNLF